jgi:hypothetical protein
VIAGPEKFSFWHKDVFTVILCARAAFISSHQGFPPPRARLPDMTFFPIGRGAVPFQQRRELADVDIIEFGPS